MSKDCFPMGKWFYQKIKDDLKERCKNVRYFNWEFFKTFDRCFREGAENRKNGVDDSYYVGNVRLYHHWDQVYKSDFYNKNSCAYCEFLEIYYNYV